MLHSEVVARLSNPLNALVNGQMKEANEACVVWEDVDVHTFVRFSKFAYTGDYDAPEPRLVVECSDETTIENSELPFANVSFPSTPKGGNRWSMGTPSQQYDYPDHRFHLLWLGIDDYDPWDDTVGVAQTPALNQQDEDYTEVFLSHARMAIFADYYGVSTLETLALTKLASLLVDFLLWEGRARDVIRLISYVYESTPHLDNSTCALRVLVAQYSAYQIESLW